ncbi:MAG TPA: metal-sensitive transcriptional regulator [Smithellaceae bacterium]|nr:metal-sensitive transcriptional regulator [Smithellaceae bacterium]
MDTDKKKILDRLRRVEGQVRGIQRLIEEDAPCQDVLTQVAAATSAMKKTGAAIVSAHMKKCLDDSPAASGKSRDEFSKALLRFIDLS